jgi:hypothetical protein
MMILRENTTSTCVLCSVHVGFSLSTYLHEHMRLHLPFELPANFYQGVKREGRGSGGAVGKAIKELGNRGGNWRRRERGGREGEVRCINLQLPTVTRILIYFLE